GQPVTVTTADGTTLQGKLRVVAPTVAALNRTGLVYADLRADERVRPGLVARGEVEIGRGAGLGVPPVRAGRADGYSYVFVLERDDTVERRRIETGAVTGSSIEVLSGVRAGDVIVHKGAGFLKDNDIVNVAASS